jgi:hypothetical protein
VDDHAQVACARHRQLRHATPFVGPEHDPFARGAQHEQPVEARAGVEREQRTERVLVQPLAGVTQRRDRCRQSP